MHVTDRVGCWTRAVDGEDCEFEWFHNRASLGVQAEPTLFIDAVTPATAGEYYCVVRNADGAVTSPVFLLEVPSSQPHIVSQPQSDAIRLDGTFDVQLEGTVLFMRTRCMRVLDLLLSCTIRVT